MQISTQLTIGTLLLGTLSNISIAESDDRYIDDDVVSPIVDPYVDIGALQRRGKLEGWTFTISDNYATKFDLADLTGLVVPRDWRLDARFDEGDGAPMGTIPTSYDWRNVNGENFCTPIRNQAGCGSCWAFAVIGSMESCIRIYEGQSTDLSEQWLVSCCGLGGCSGEWPGEAANFLLESGAYVDECGENGAVLESEFPYVGYDAPCDCPYNNLYTINDWAFIGPQWGTPSTSQLKEAILEHGPITVCVTADAAFQAYDGGIFNSNDSSPINHAVVLVGWDDTQGENGVWFLRNQWSTWWGEAGYMRMEYGCSNIGFNGLYLDYPTQNGACCIGTNGDCTVLPQLNCDAGGGVFNGFGSDCVNAICSQPCDGDATSDGWVDVEDMWVVIDHWGSTESTADLNNDGHVDVTDLLEVVEHWGSCD